MKKLTDTQKSIEDLLNRRNIAIKSLLKSLDHYKREDQFAILTSWLSIEELEKLAQFQSRSGSK